MSEPIFDYTENVALSLYSASGNIKRILYMLLHGLIEVKKSFTRLGKEPVDFRLSSKRRLIENDWPGGVYALYPEQSTFNDVLLIADISRPIISEETFHCARRRALRQTVAPIRSAAATGGRFVRVVDPQNRRALCYLEK